MTIYDSEYRDAVMSCLSTIEDLHRWSLSLSHSEVAFAECDSKAKLKAAWQARNALQKAEEILDGLEFEQELTL
jgi:hypothetical protein